MADYLKRGGLTTGGGREEEGGGGRSAERAEVGRKGDREPQ